MCQWETLSRYAARELQAYTRWESIKRIRETKVSNDPHVGLKAEREEPIPSARGRTGSRLVGEIKDYNARPVKRRRP